MQALVKPAKEPITPLVARIRSLAATGVSCILVVGGTGDYFEVADCVICMDCFQARDVTQQAHAIAEQFGRTYTACGQEQAFGPVKPRVLVSLHPCNPNGESSSQPHQVPLIAVVLVVGSCCSAQRLRLLPSTMLRKQYVYNSRAETLA